MSRKPPLVFLTVLTLAVGSFCAGAQDASSPAGTGARPSFFQHMLQAMDTNGDGKISLDEYLAAASARFKTIDTQNKGRIDAADIAASPQTLQRNNMIAQHIVSHLDSSGNGYVTRAEFLAAAKTRFAKLDTAGTGQLTPSQFAARGEHRKGMSGTRAQFAQKIAQRRFDKLDANHDGVVTLDEYLAFAGARFDQLDAAHTGTLTAQQIAASPRMLHHDEFAAQRALRRLGTSANGSVTQDQYLAAAKARFAKLDANGDGFIEAGEVTGHRWARGNPQQTAN